MFRVQLGMQAMEKMGQLAKVFGQGGLFRVTVDADGMIKGIAEA
jgi:hypothetical protein